MHPRNCSFRFEERVAVCDLKSAVLPAMSSVRLPDCLTAYCPLQMCDDLFALLESEPGRAGNRAGATDPNTRSWGPSCSSKQGASSGPIRRDHVHVKAELLDTCCDLAKMASGLLAIYSHHIA